MVPVWVNVASIAICLLSGVWYFMAVLNRAVYPSFYAFLAYSASTSIAVISAYQLGNMTAFYPGLTNVALLVMTLILLLIQKRVSPFGMADGIGWVVIVIGIAAAWFTVNAILSLLSTLIFEFMATWMVLAKMKEFPRQEVLLPWVMVCFGYGLPLMFDLQLDIAHSFSWVVVLTTSSVAIYGAWQNNQKLQIE